MNDRQEERPTLQTERLILRPLREEDAPEVERLAGSREVAATTLNVPHPYPPGAAATWIASHAGEYARGRLANFGIERREDGALIGVVGLVLNRDHARGEIGYWIGLPYWGNGYCTEAARAVVRYGFEVRQLNRIYAGHFGSNPASGRVMQKIGMSYEGRQRQHLRKWEAYEDEEMYAILRSDWERLQERQG